VSIDAVRGAEVVALTPRHAELDERRQLVCGLDAFRRDRGPDLAPEGDK
jgi:hypothetical protein